MIILINGLERRVKVTIKFGNKFRDLGNKVRDLGNKLGVYRWEVTLQKLLKCHDRMEVGTSDRGWERVDEG